MSRLRRSVLFMPADSLKKITKATTLDVDCVVMDLEDGVALNRKAEGRATAIEACQTLDFGTRERVIRMNPPGSAFAQDDLNAILQAKPDAIAIPKVECADDLLQVDHFLTAAEQKHSWAEGTIRLFGIIESARGILFLPQIAAATERLDVLMFGSEDLAGDMGAIRTPGGHEIAYARSAVVMAAAAYKLDAIDTVYPNFNDPEGLAKETQTAREMGYCGKMAIHPKQVPVYHKVFSPSDDEIDYAQRLLQAHDEQQKQGTGAFAFQGKMVDMPMVRAAQKIVAQAKTIGKLT